MSALPFNNTLINRSCYTERKYYNMFETDPKDYSQITPRFSYNRFQCLGRGSFGKVYLGWDAKQKCQIAVKHIHAKNIKDSCGKQKRQIEILQKMKHPNIMEFYDSYETASDGLFLFLQLCQQGTFSTLLAKKKLTQAEAMQFFEQLIAGMAYINDQGIFHRDLKPDNLLLTDNNKLKIADFGTARDLKNTSDLKTTFKKAPEVILKDVYEKLGEKYTQKCDVFSTGYILYQLLTGQRLTKNISQEYQLKQFLYKKCSEGLTFDHPALTPRWNGLLTKMLQFDSNNRPSFQEINQEMQGFLALSHKPPAQRFRGESERQFSANILKDYKTFLTNEERRSNLLINVLKILHAYQHEQSQLIPRIYKLLVLYFSLSRYCCLSAEGLYFLHQPQTIEIGQHNFQTLGNRFLVDDKKILLEFIEAMAARINHGIQQIRALLLGQIIPELEFTQSKQGSSEHRLVKQFINQLEISNFRKQEYSNSLDYTSSFRKCVRNLFKTRAETQILSNSDLKTYLVLLLTARNQQPIQDNSFPPSVEEIKEMDRCKLLAEINLLKTQAYKGM